MVKKKLRRFAENETFPHLFQQTYHELLEGFSFKGNWNEKYFCNPNPIVLELGCGKGEYTVNLAEKYPSTNFIGIDIKGARLWRGCKTVEEKKLKNVAFIRTKIELIGMFFAPGEIDEIWLTFPDPQLRKKKAKKRMTSPQFISRYREILKPDGVIHLKTDNDNLFNYTLKTIEESGHHLLDSCEDLYSSEVANEATQIQTFYEKMFLNEGIPIKYLKFKLNESGQ
jgi:tRNA (guanine-N7-)-methyltransferase